MPLTKDTPRSSAEKPFSCEKCSYSTDRKANLARHSKQHENKEGWLDLDPGNLSDVMGDLACSSSSSDTSLSKQSEQDNNEDLQPSASSNELEVGRVVRKQTQPAPVAAPKRKLPPHWPSPPCPPTAGNKKGGALAYIRRPEHCIPQKAPRVENTPLHQRVGTSASEVRSSATQTEAVQRHKIKRTCKKYKEGTKSVEEIEWEEEFY